VCPRRPRSLALQKWRERAEQESFNQNILSEIDKFKKEQKRRIQSLHVMGEHHEANRVEETLAHVEQVEQRMKRLLGEN